MDEWCPGGYQKTNQKTNSKGSSTRRYLQSNKRAFSEEDCKVAPCTRCSRSVAACKNRSEKS